MKNYLLILAIFCCSFSFAQNTISGNVKDENNKPVFGVNITVQDSDNGTITDSEGVFKLNVSKDLPMEILISGVGFKSQSITITEKNQSVDIVLLKDVTMLDEIVVSASRTPERVRESPVTIERFDSKDVKSSASPTFYDGLENLKEVQMNTSSMSFKSINTRGFATISNNRFMQLVDGMDNSSPLLNFVLGNLIGVSELDVANVELLPGASSALYGANAFNGIMFMNSKNPFTSEGISTYVKYGQTSQKAAGNNEYYDYGVRAAHKFNDYFAAKANFTFMKGTEWYATDYRDRDLVNMTGKDRSYQNYDGINVYGDEVTTLLPAGIGNVSRTGYNEVDLTDNKVKNAKIDFSLHFKPFKNDFEVIWQSKFGFGNSVYQGANRYYLNGFFMQQHKLEFKGKNFFLRGYTTTEDGGKSYDMVFTGININREWKSDAQWFGEYAGGYLNAISGNVPNVPSGDPVAAHKFAREFADMGRFKPGTPEFKAAFDKVIANPDVMHGSKLVDNSRVYHSDANYNFKDIIKFAEIQVGGSYRKYQLNSHGRIYTDAESMINYDEYGIYTQLTKKMMEDRLKFTGSIRYDKAQNFDGNYSPRLSLVYAAGESKNHIFRASFQTGFRNPTTQDQYIGFNVGNAYLLGSAPDNLTRYSETLPVSVGPAELPLGQVYAGGTTSSLNGNNAYYNSYTYSSVKAFGAVFASNPTLGNLPVAAVNLEKANVGLVKPEEVKAIEIGYRGQLGKFNIDLNGYYNVYNNFIGNVTVISPLYGKASNNIDFTQGANSGYVTNPEVQSVHALVSGNYRAYQLYTNTDIEIKSLGAGLGLAYKLPRDFEVSANYNYAQFDFDQSKNPGFESNFNTPKHRAKIGLKNENLFKNFGFNISGRWSSEYMWESTFTDGMIDAVTVIDAQVNYGIPSLKSVLKVGATNIGGKEYRQLIGPGLIGQQYFVSLLINP